MTNPDTPPVRDPDFEAAERWASVIVGPNSHLPDSQRPGSIAAEDANLARAFLALRAEERAELERRSTSAAAGNVVEFAALRASQGEAVAGSRTAWRIGASEAVRYVLDHDTPDNDGRPLELRIADAVLASHPPRVEGEAVAWITGAMLLDAETCVKPAPDEPFYDAFARELRSRNPVAAPVAAQGVTEEEFCNAYRNHYHTAATDRDILFCEERLLDFVRGFSALTGGDRDGK